MHEGIESISLNPDSVIETWLYLAGQGERKSAETQANRV
jgi:pyruvate,water dikinase